MSIQSEIERIKSSIAGLYTGATIMGYDFSSIPEANKTLKKYVDNMATVGYGVIYLPAAGTFGNTDRIDIAFPLTTAGNLIHRIQERRLEKMIINAKALSPTAYGNSVSSIRNIVSLELSNVLIGPKSSGTITYAKASNSIPYFYTEQLSASAFTISTPNAGVLRVVSTSNTTVFMQNTTYDVICLLKRWSV